ncbi:MAG: hypothetical protein AB8B87_09100 [Granulosicoccus sp.]
MTALSAEDDLQKLHKLYVLREKRALEAIAEQRIELDRVKARLIEQENLITSLKTELAALYEMRSATAIQDITALSLRAESDRRHTLTQELEMEVFYLSGFEVDVSDAQIELSSRKRRWARIGDQIKALSRVKEKNGSKARRSQSRKDDALLDDRQTVVQR